MDIAFSPSPTFFVSLRVVDLCLRPEEAMQYYGLLSDGQGGGPRRRAFLAMPSYGF